LSVSLNNKNPYAVLIFEDLLIIVDFDKKAVINRYKAHNHKIVMLNLSNSGDTCVTSSEKVINIILLIFIC
jgi:hypothetical protein